MSLNFSNNAERSGITKMLEKKAKHNVQKPTKMKKACQYKNEFAFFKLISRLCPDTHKMANIGEFPWS